MNKPKEFDNMSPYFHQDIEGRIFEIEREIEYIKSLKSSFRPTVSDFENMSDNYQYNLEMGYALSELTDELDCLRYQQWLDAKNESELNAFESQSTEQ